MKNRPGLVRRDGMYIVRRRFPVHAAEALKKSQFKVSLHTKDPQEARRLYDAAILDFHAQVAAASINAPNTVASPQVVPVSRLQAIALERVRTRWQAEELELWKPHTTFRSEDDPVRLLRIELDLLRGNAEEVYHGFLWAAEQALTAAGLEDADSTSKEVLANFLRRGDIDIFGACLRHYEGDTSHALRDNLFTSLNGFDGRAASVDVPAAAKAERSSDSRVLVDAGAAKSVNQAIALFTRDPQRANLSQKNAAGYATGFKLLREVVGGSMPLTSVSRAHAREVQALLEHLPPNASKRFSNMSLIEAVAHAKSAQLPAISSTTAKNVLSTLSSFFNWAMAEHLIKVSPFVDLKPLQKAHGIDENRRPYSPAELAQLFSNRLYQQPYALVGSACPGRYWVPLLALYHGARMNELCQLDTDDVRMVEGIWCIKITDQSSTGGKKQLKTKSSHRTIPLHPIFHYLGFIDYVRATKELRRDRLFSDLTLASTGYYSDNFSKWFYRYRKRQGVDSRLVDFHSFRHGFRDACRAMKVTTEDAVRIAGWSKGDAVESGYGLGAPLQHLVEELGKIRFLFVEALLPALQVVNEASKETGIDGQEAQTTT